MNSIRVLTLGCMSSFLKCWQVHFAATEAALRVHFGRCGNIKRVALLVEPATGKPKGLVEINISNVVIDTFHL
jgi:hypothetical protein